MRTLNLASHPFRNERLPRLVFVAAVVLVGLVSVGHGLMLRDLVGAPATGRRSEIAALKAESQRLRREAQSLEKQRPDAVLVKEWALLKELVDRRTFEWAAVFESFEDALPAGARLTSVSPKIEKKTVFLEFEAVVRSAEDPFDFVETIEKQPEFEAVELLGRSAVEDGNRLRCRLRYVAVPSPSPAPPKGTPGGGVS